MKKITSLFQFPQAAQPRYARTLAVIAVASLSLGLFAANTITTAAPKPERDLGKEQSPETKPDTDQTFELEGSMTVDQMDAIVKRLDASAASPRKGMWQFTIEKTTVIIVTDETNNRMRILSPVTQEESLSEEDLRRIMQANFDTALDARYAVAKGVLWATYIHPLKALHPRQFISGIGQTINLVKTFGTTYTSGAMTFGGGDSRGIIQRQLLDQLQKKGLPI